MEGIELLLYWKPYVDLAIRQVWEVFHVDRKLILTESDLKCNIYKYLSLLNLEQPFMIHTEVTHRHFQENQQGLRWRFRDISLLNPVRFHMNDDVIALNEQLSKGFFHHGEAIFMELKFQVLPVGAGHAREIPVIDIEHLKAYYHDDHTPKLAYVLWGSQNDLFYEQNLIQRMIDKFREFSQYECEHQKLPNEQIFGFIFNSDCIFKIEYIRGDWVLINLLRID